MSQLERAGQGGLLGTVRCVAVKGNETLRSVEARHVDCSKEGVCSTSSLTFVTHTPHGPHGSRRMNEVKSTCCCSVSIPYMAVLKVPYPVYVLLLGMTVADKATHVQAL